MLTSEVLAELGVPGESVVSVVLFGIETHICVQQTALDLTSRGFDVHVVADACSSRTQTDRMFALEVMTTDRPAQSARACNARERLHSHVKRADGLSLEVMQPSQKYECSDTLELFHPPSSQSHSPHHHHHHCNHHHCRYNHHYISAHATGRRVCNDTRISAV
jgi:hypothetical protein